MASSSEQPIRKMSGTAVGNSSMTDTIAEQVKMKIITALGGTGNLDTLFIFFQTHDTDGSAGLDPEEFRNAMASCDLVLSGLEVRSLYANLGVAADEELDLQNFIGMMKEEGGKGGGWERGGWQKSMRHQRCGL